MGQEIAFNTDVRRLPDWVNDDVRLYLDHVEGGQTIRALARHCGVHASTILRKVRKTEASRDDPLIDRALLELGRLRRLQTGGRETAPQRGGGETGNRAGKGARKCRAEGLPIDSASLKRDARRILHALLEDGAVLAVVPEVETAVVVVETEDGRPRQLATLARRAAEAMALLGWIEGGTGGKVARYRISGEGRRALGRLLAETESTRMRATAQAGTLFSGPRSGAGGARAGRRRAPGADSPLMALARRRDKSGRPYLSDSQIRAGEQLRTDFELTRLGGAAALNWESIMRGRVDGGAGSGEERKAGRLDARRRLERALAALGPELADIALRTCCQLKGMEATEAELQMPARAGKYVLRIALNILARHYAAEDPQERDLIY